MDNLTALHIKVPKGSIVKVDDHPVKLKEAIFLKSNDKNWLDKHEIMDWVFDSEDSE